MNKIEKKLDNTLKHHGVSYGSRRKIRKTASNFVYDTSVIAASTVVSTIVLDVVEGTACVAGKTVIHAGHFMTRGINKVGKALSDIKDRKTTAAANQKNQEIACAQSPSEDVDGKSAPNEEVGEGED